MNFTGTPEEKSDVVGGNGWEILDHAFYNLGSKKLHVYTRGDAFAAGMDEPLFMIEEEEISYGQRFTRPEDILR